LKQDTLYLPSEHQDLLKLFLRKFQPEDQPVKAILVLAHGLVEHGERYSRLAETLTSEGFIVYAYDHRGHGKSDSPVKGQVVYAKQGGQQAVVNDLLMIANYAKKEYPEVPLSLFAHSMGSYIARNALFKDSKIFDAVILSGTGPSQKPLVYLGIFISGILKKLFKDLAPSSFMTATAFAGFNSKCKPRKTDFDWLSRDEKEVDKYISDPLCGAKATAGLWHDFLQILESANNKKQISAMENRNLPLLLISGSKDPAVLYTKGPEKVFSLFRESGLKDVDLKIYPEARHEVVNEVNREEVASDILTFLKSKLKLN
jgi:alpha-beta hydrolase superfamily lysophospholipase